MRNTGLVPLEQGVRIDRNKAEDAAAQNAVNNKKSQPAMPLQRHIMVLTRDQEEEKDNKPTAAALEEPTDADVDSDMGSDDTTDSLKVNYAQSLPETEEHSIRLADRNFDRNLVRHPVLHHPQDGFPSGFQPITASKGSTKPRTSYKRYAKIFQSDSF